MPELPTDTNITKGDVMSLPQSIQKGFFDVVSVLALLEHLPNPSEAIGQAYGALHPGGMFVASCPDPFWDALATKCGLLKGEHHVTDMNQKRMIALVQEAGLEVLAFERFMWAPIGFLPYMKIAVSPSFSLTLDRTLHRLKFFDGLFVNQCIIAKKPI